MMSEPDKMSVLVISSVAILLTAIGLITTWVKNAVDYRYNRSQFYLEQIKNYFKNAISILEEGSNNNIKWHQAIMSIKTADDLRSQLTNKEHKHICFMDYFETGFSVVNILNQIDDFRFFYGISNYRDQDSFQLYRESMPEKLDEKCLRIDPEELRCLCIFIDKINKANLDIRLNKIGWDKIFSKDYFFKKINENVEISQLTKCSLKTVFEYIADFCNNSKCKK